jgi:predicted  nucleic acid-binding Zn-ribbon protein
MTKIIMQNSELWTFKKIQSLVGLETELLKKQVRNIQNRIAAFEHRYGKADRDSLYGQVDDMELIEWEGEIETMNRMQKKLTSLEQIAYEYE